MTILGNLIPSNFISATGSGSVTDGISILLVGILLILLVEKVVIDAYKGKPDECRTVAFTMVIIPLLFVMLVVIVLRMAQILHL